MNRRSFAKTLAVIPFVSLVPVLAKPKPIEWVARGVVINHSKMSFCAGEALFSTEIRLEDGNIIALCAHCDVLCQRRCMIIWFFPNGRSILEVAKIKDYHIYHPNTGKKLGFWDVKVHETYKVVVDL